MGFDPTAIEPDCTFPIDDKGKWDLYFSLLRTTVSGLLKEYSDTENALRALPIVKADTVIPSMNTFSVYILAPAEHTQGSGRFITDALNTYLIPGKYTPILLSRSARFTLREAKNSPIFFIEYLIQLPNGSDFDILKINLPKLLRNIRLSLSAARYARRIIQKRKISDLEKQLIMTENIQDLFELSNKKANSPFFAEIPKRFVEELSKKPSIELADSLFANAQTPFKRSIFYELHRLISHLPLPLQHEYSQRLLIRILGIAYLFRKVVSYAETELTVPQVLFKLFPVSGSGQNTHRCGLLLVIHLPENAQRFDSQALFKVCQRLLPLLRKNREKSFCDAQDGSHYKTLFIELAKEHLLPFSKQDFFLLNHSLQNELEKYLEKMDSVEEMDISIQQQTLIKALQSQLVEKGRYNDSLLKGLVGSFSTSAEINDEWIDALNRSYYMLFSLLDENTAHVPFLTAAQTVEDVFIVAVSTENPQVHEKISSIMLSERSGSSSIRSLGFKFESVFLSVLYYRYPDGKALIAFRGHLLEQLQRLQIEIEARL